VKIVVGALQSVNVNIAGDIFYLLRSDGRVSVKGLVGGETRSYELEAGMGFRSSGGDRYRGFELRDISGVDQIIEFEISDRDVFDNRAVGVVSVVNSDKRRTDLNGAFMLTGNRAASAGVLSALNLRNPVGSLRNIYVNQVVVSANLVSDCVVGLTPTIAADQALAGITSISLGVGAGVSKRVNSVVSNSVAKIDQFYSDVWPKGGMRGISRTYIAANDSFEFRFTEPVRLDQGSGMVVMSLVANQVVSASFEFFEEVAD
jgi:hypothetical protein